MRPTFKQFTVAYDHIQAGGDPAELDPQLAEAFFQSDEKNASDLFRKANTGDQAALDKLGKLMGNLEAKKKIVGGLAQTHRAYKALVTKVNSGRKADSDKKDASWNTKKAEVTGKPGEHIGVDPDHTLKGGPERAKGHYDKLTKKWVMPNDPYAHVGKHD